MKKEDKTSGPEMIPWDQIASELEHGDITASISVPAPSQSRFLKAPIIVRSLHPLLSH